MWENKSNIFLICHLACLNMILTCWHTHPDDTLHPPCNRGPWSMIDRGLWRYENACKYFWGRKCTIISINTIILMKSLKSFKMLIFKNYEVYIKSAISIDWKPVVTIQMELNVIRCYFHIWKTTCICFWNQQPCNDIEVL